MHLYYQRRMRAARSGRKLRWRDIACLPVYVMRLNWPISVATGLIGSGQVGLSLISGKEYYDLNFLDLNSRCRSAGLENRSLTAVVVRMELLDVASAGKRTSSALNGGG